MAEGRVDIPRPLLMVGCFWIAATSMKKHTRPDCPGLASARRSGWRPFIRPPGYGRDFYEWCRRCNG